MYARVTTVNGNPAAIDREIAFVKDTVQPLVEGLPGSLGLNMLVARDLGRVVVATAWETATARAASNKELSPIRDEAGRIMSGEARPEDLEYAMTELAHPQQPGCWARSTRLSAPPDRAEDAVTQFRDMVLPGVRAMAGFCSAVLLLDRPRGKANAVTVWDDLSALEASRPKVVGLRNDTAQRSGATIEEVFESELVIAGLRPAFWQPADRTIELPSEQRV